MGVEVTCCSEDVMLSQNHQKAYPSLMYDMTAVSGINVVNVLVPYQILDLMLP